MISSMNCTLAKLYTHFDPNYIPVHLKCWCAYRKNYVKYLQKHHENDLKMKIIWLSCTHKAETGNCNPFKQKMLHKNERVERALKLMIF